MGTTNISCDGLVLARYISGDSWTDGLGFYSNDFDFVQVGTWKYNKDKELLAHIHKQVVRSITHTQEVLFVRKGKIKASIYKPDKSFLQDIIATEGDILILLNGGHSYTILEDNTMVLEIKNGPYPGPTVDRERF